MADSRAAYSADDIRERTSIVDIIAPHVRLRKQGKRLAGLCPFHPDQSPSFTVDPDKGVWHCFGCGAGGNVFHFLMRSENLTFPEAAEKLADRLGVRLKGQRDNDRTRDARELLERINDEAADFFRRQLKASARARHYLAQRELSEEMIERFRIGWAPAGWDGLYLHLRRGGYQDADIEKSGLCVPRQRGDGCYDRFRGRVIFPILDAQERVIGFGGRILEGDGGAAAPGPRSQGEAGAAAKEVAGETPAPQAKYINSPETALFRKGRTLYAFPAARKAMGERGRAIVVEGYFDVIACHAAGFTETVATMGTALTQEHLEVLRRHTDRVYAAFDSDSAGMKAVLRSQELFEAARLDVRVVRLPEGEDPDSFVVKHGAQALEHELEQAPTAVDYRLALLVESHPDTQEGRLALMQEAVEVLAGMSDAVAQTHYVRRLAERCCLPNLERVGVMEQALHRELRKRTPAKPTRAPAAAGASPSAAVRVERRVLAAMLHSEVVARWVVEQLSPQVFCDDIHRRVFERLTEKLNNAAWLDINALIAQEQQQEVCALLSELTLTHDEAAADDDELRQAVERMCEWRDARRCRELQEKVRAGDAGAAELLELTDLNRQRSQVTARRSLGDGAT